MLWSVADLALTKKHTVSVLIMLTSRMELVGFRLKVSFLNYRENFSFNCHGQSFPLTWFLVSGNVKEAIIQNTFLTTILNSTKKLEGSRLHSVPCFTTVLFSRLLLIVPTPFIHPEQHA